MRWYEVLFYKVPLIVLGIMMLVKPRLLWKISTYTTVKEGEPTNFYLAIMAVGGIAILLYGVITLILNI